MSRLTVLYATDEMTSRLHDAVDGAWDVFCPQSLDKALAMSVFYVPHVIVVDGDSAWLNAFTAHVLATTAASARGLDIVVRLADTPLDVDVPEFISYNELPADTTAEALAELLQELDDQRERELRAGGDAVTV